LKPPPRGYEWRMADGQYVLANSSTFRISTVIRIPYVRRNFMVPIPRVSSWEELNTRLEAESRKRRLRRLRGHTEIIGERFERDHTRRHSVLLYQLLLVVLLNRYENRYDFKK